MLGLAVFVLLLPVQSPGGGGARSAEQTSVAVGPLESRVEAYWKRRQAKDVSGAYAFYCSAYKNRVPQAEFLQLTRLTRFNLQDIRVARVNSKGDRAEVTISYRFLMPTVSQDMLASESTEVWLHEAGEWCKEDEPLILPFPRPPTTCRRNTPGDSALPRGCADLAHPSRCWPGADDLLTSSDAAAQALSPADRGGLPRLRIWP